MQTILKGLRFARQLVETRALGEFCQEEVYPGIHIQSDRELSAYVMDSCDTVYHPSGTCRMGNSVRSDTVVYPNLKVKGMRNLRVCDASVFPSMVTVNINNTVMMVAEKAADLIIQDYQ